jgi:hypothetical protein
LQLCLIEHWELEQLLLEHWLTLNQPCWVDGIQRSWSPAFTTKKKNYRLINFESQLLTVLSAHLSRSYSSRSCLNLQKQSQVQIWPQLLVWRHSLRTFLHNGIWMTTITYNLIRLKVWTAQVCWRVIIDLIETWDVLICITHCRSASVWYYQYW